MKPDEQVGCAGPVNQVTEPGALGLGAPHRPTSALGAVWRITRALLHLLHGLAICALRFHALDKDSRQERTLWWSRRLLQIMGLAIEVEGQPRLPVPGSAPVVVVANHVSWLDIFAINTVCPARFVAKSEVRRWPLIGALAAQVGTLFIERDRPRDALRVVHHLVESLHAGHVVAVFPEGTTSEGHGVLPFHANLLQAAISAEAEVQPVVLRYQDARHAASPAAVYVGDTSLVQSLWWIARARGLRVQLRWLPPRSAAGQQRRTLAQVLRADIEQGLARHR